MPHSYPLHPLATPLSGTLGRRVLEEETSRNPFQDDRGRILQSAAFRRMQGKTQVFVAGEGDHFRTRLTHTLEVTHIGRMIARELSMNEDLTECICLSHDLGHPPFGHVGEEGIDEWMQTHGGHFEHNEQSFRIVTLLEKRSSQYQGLNLNREVEDGLLKHAQIHPITKEPVHMSIEAQIANMADEIAYTAHDIDDGLSGGIFSMQDLRGITLIEEALQQSKQTGSQVRVRVAQHLMRDLLEASEALLNGSTVGTKIHFSDAMRTNLNTLRSFLAESMYTHPRVRLKAKQGKDIVKQLCVYYYANPIDKVKAIMERTGDPLHIAVKDYVSGMTDSFAWMQAAEHGLLEDDVAR